MSGRVGTKPLKVTRRLEGKFIVGNYATVYVGKCFFFTREKKSSSRENFQFYTRENSILPVKNSLKLPVKDNVYPWKILQNYTLEN